MPDLYAAHAQGLNDPAIFGFDITPHASTNFGYLTRGIWVGGAGDVAIVWSDDTVTVFSAVPAGTLLPFRAKRVNAVGTTATLLRGLL